MNKHIISGAVALAFVTAHSASSQTVTGHTEKKTYFTTGSFSSVPAFQYTIIDGPISIPCPGKSGCTIEIQGSLVISARGTGDTLYGIDVLVDGTAIPNTAADGTLPADSSPVSVSAFRNFQVTQGTHTLQIRMLSNVPQDIYKYQFDYRVYTP